MGTDRRIGTRARAFAKINRSLRVIGRRPDGYHDLRTTFQTIALHDTLTFVEVPGPFEIRCDHPRCPVDETNLIWRAADVMWRAAGRRGSPAGLRVQVVKRIPMRGGLGGGSSDAAAVLRVLNDVWRAGVGDAEMVSLAAMLGADVPFFLRGGAVLGLDRGDLLFSLEEPPPAWVVLVLPPFGVSTGEAFDWFDQAQGSRRPRAGQPGERAVEAQADCGNDLEAPVAARHPSIRRITRELRRCGALHAAMSGSGSAVFGLFGDRARAAAAAAAASRAGRQVVLTRTMSRRRYRSLSRPERAHARESRPGARTGPGRT